jgi:hypothetical protein
LKFTTTGFWHDGLPSSSTTGVFELALPIDGGTRFYDCPTKSNCAVNEFSGAVTCKEHSAGVLCALCAQGYTTSSAGRCIECTGSAGEVLWPWLLAIVAACAAGHMWKTRGRAWWAHAKPAVLNGRDLGLVVLFKLGIGFFQVVLFQPQVFSIRFPQLYIDFLAGFNFLRFGLPFQSFECFVPTDNHDRLHTVALLSTIVMAVLFAGVYFRSSNMHSNVLTLCIVPSYLVYPTFSSVFFQTFNCREIDQDRFLVSDVSIDCDSSEHASAEVVAGLMIFTFSIGLPVLYLALLYPHRRSLTMLASHTDVMDAGHQPSSNEALKFLYSDYKPRFWWWESIEIARKLVLTGALVQFEKGSLVQLVLAMVIIILHMLVLAHFKPYKRARDGVLALFTYSMLLMVFFGAVLLSAQAALPGDHLFRRGISAAGVAGGLVFAVLSVLVVAIAIAVDEARVVAVLSKFYGTFEPIAIAVLPLQLIGLFHCRCHCSQSFQICCRRSIPVRFCFH